MENVSIVSYSLKEKYFQIDPEKRVRRYQYFVRSIVPGILMGLALMVWGAVLIPVFGLALLGMGKILSIVSSVLFLGISYFFYELAKNNSVKRCHDFGNDGNLALRIVHISFIVGVIGILIWVWETLWVLPSMNSLAMLSQMSEWITNAQAMELMSQSQPIHQKIFGIIQMIVGIVSLILWIFLVFRPGNPGDNVYGKDPINTKVSFLG